jgi:death-on-curing protein
MEHGGASGVRDMNGLKSAISRPFQTFCLDDLYPSVIEKAAVISESIVKNNPFVDGNKRTGLVLMIFILRKNEFILNATQLEMYDFVIEIASGNFDKEDIKVWLLERTTGGLPQF